MQVKPGILRHINDVRVLFVRRPAFGLEVDGIRMEPAEFGERMPQVLDMHIATELLA